MKVKLHTLHPSPTARTPATTPRVHTAEGSRQVAPAQEHAEEVRGLLRERMVHLDVPVRAQRADRRRAGGEVDLGGLDLCLAARSCDAGAGSHIGPFCGRMVA